MHKVTFRRGQRYGGRNRVVILVNDEPIFRGAIRQHRTSKVWSVSEFAHVGEVAGHKWGSIAEATKSIEDSIHRMHKAQEESVT